MKLIVGLGNPGDRYAANRHNIGFMAADEIARSYRFSPWRKRFQGMAAEGQIGAEKCVLLKPGTFMNESGRSVGEAMRFYKLSVDDVIVIHDELDLVPGTVRVKSGGGNAGHNGLKSISAHIGNDYKRVRLGIGHPGDKSLVANYVLQDFAKADQAWLVPFLDAIAKGMARLVEGADAAFLNESARRRPQSPAEAANGVKTGAGVIRVLPAAAREGGSAAVAQVVVEEPEPSAPPPNGATAPTAVDPDGPANIVALQKRSFGAKLKAWFATRVRGGRHA